MNTAATQPATTAALLAEARTNFAAVRTMDRNRRLRRYEDRNGGGDTTMRLRRAESAVAGLPRNLQGMVWAEHRLAARLAENRDAGQDRPELRARMSRLRRDLRDAVA